MTYSTLSSIVPKMTSSPAVTRVQTTVPLKDSLGWKALVDAGDEATVLANISAMVGNATGHTRSSPFPCTK